MKKVCLLGLLFLMLVCLALPVAADDSDMYLTIPEKVAPGDEITITVNLSDNSEYYAVYLCPEYDKELFTLVDARWLVEGIVADFDIELGDGVILFDQLLRLEGPICEFTLSANEGIATQTTTVGCESVASDSTDTLIEFINSDADNISILAPKAFITGRITSYNPQETLKIEVCKDGNNIYNTEIVATNENGMCTQQFEINNIDIGTYDLVITKAGHLSYSITGIVVPAEGVDLCNHTDAEIAMITLVSGDINGDGSIDLQDVALLTSSSTYSKSYEEAACKAADVNGDGKFDLQDLAIVTSSNNYGKSAPVVGYTEAAG